MDIIKILPKYRVEEINSKINEKKTIRKRKTTEQYKEEIQVKNPNVIVLDEYVDAKTKIMHRCLIHNVDWLTSPTNVLNGSGCSKCKSDKIKNKLTMNNDEYINLLSQKNPKVIVLEKYVNGKTKILHKYLDCGCETMLLPQVALLGFGCDKCTRSNVGTRFKHTQENYEKKVYKNNPNIKILGEYINATEPIDVMCLIDGYKWSPIAGSLSRTKFSGCPECAKRRYGDALRKGLEQYIEDVLNVNPYIKVIGTEYINGNTPLLHKCSRCDYEWRPLPCNILGGSGCPNCNMPHGEREIMKILDKYCLLYNPQKTFSGLVGVGGGLLSYDFYLPNYKLLIEFQGEQHEKAHSGLFGGEEQFVKQQEHDRRKREYAKEHNIHLLEIWYYDIDNIEDILTKTLNLKLESVETVIPA